MTTQFPVGTRTASGVSAVSRNSGHPKSELLSTYIRIPLWPAGDRFRKYIRYPDISVITSERRLLQSLHADEFVPAAGAAGLAEVPQDGPGEFAGAMAAHR